MVDELRAGQWLGDVPWEILGTECGAPGSAAGPVNDFETSLVWI
jgi:hypothetical protein